MTARLYPEGQKIVDDVALKFDQDKLPLHLIDPLFDQRIAEVLAFGAKKYAAWNWAKGTFEWHRLYRSAIGHLQAWYLGEDNDPESGLSHISHAACNLMFLTRYIHDNLGTDTRPPFQSKPLHTGPGPEAQQNPPVGRGAGGDGAAPGDTVLREQRERTRQDASGGWYSDGRGLQNERVLDETSEQRPKKHLHPLPRVEGYLWFYNESGHFWYILPDRKQGPSTAAGVSN